MKFPKTITILALIAVFAALTIPALGQQASQGTTDPQQQQQQAQPQSSGGQASSPSAVQTFQGTISRAQGQYVLQDSATGASYQLDDQKKAKSFAGKSVKVMGTLDASSNMIHVSSIQSDS